MSADLGLGVGFDRERIYRLLPSHARVLDARPGDQPGPLEELIAVIAGEVAVLEENLAQLYDDLFIETCAEWVVPYVADLLGVRGLLDAGDGAFSQRAYVANTIAYRRRKGTAAVLEQLARDVTNWRANAVEFFERLAATQYLNHVRPGNEGLAGVRDHLRLTRVGTPFDPLARTVDVRRIAGGRGRYNIPNVGIFLWRLESFRLTKSPAVTLADGRRHLISPLGVNLQLATQPQPEPSLEHLATAFEVPMPLGRRELHAALDEHYGGSRSIAVELDGVDAVPEGTKPSAVVTVCDLSDQGGTWAHVPSGTGIALDPVLGRIAVGELHANKPVRVSFSYRFSAAMGGGEYSRPSAADPDRPPPLLVGNQPRDPGAPAVAFTAVQPALAALEASTADGVIEVDDSGRYVEGALSVKLGADQQLELRAADGSRPTLVVGGDLSVEAAPGAGLTLDGLLVVGGAVRVTGSPALVRVSHCTLAPGRLFAGDGTPHHPAKPSLILDLDGAPGTVVEIDRSITGPLRLPAEGCTLTVTDSIVDSPARGVPAARRPALVSGDLTTLPAFGPGPVAVLVTIGDDGPHPATFTPVPNDLAGTAGQLEGAVRAAHAAPAFANARVLAAENRLVVLPGRADQVTIADAGTDQTATQLGLTRPAARQVLALAGGALPETLDAARTGQPLNATIGGSGPREVALAPAPTTRAEARDRLQAALRAEGAGPAFDQAIVATLDAGLLVLPGEDGAAALIEANPATSGALEELALEAAVPAIAGGMASDLPGPPARIERTTVLGAASVRQLDLASDSIFTGPVRAGRRQAGCVRFCYLAEGSRTPRRYGCQPAPGTDPLLVRPVFTALRYGEPGYCQLGRGCPREIARGAGDEAEMGAFHDLYQPQREDALRVRLDEYLRFSLEAGIFYAS